jgi:hypothetical protein
MFNLLIYKKKYRNNLELKEIYTMHNKQVHNVYRFMYHYICKLRINLISRYFLPSWEIWLFPTFLPTLQSIHIVCFLWLSLINLSIRHFSTNKWSDVQAFLEKPIWLSWIKLFSSRKLSSLLFSIIFKILPKQFDTAMPQ